MYRRGGVVVAAGRKTDPRPPESLSKPRLRKMKRRVYGPARPAGPPPQSESSAPPGSFPGLAGGGEKEPRAQSPAESSPELPVA